MVGGWRKLHHDKLRNLHPSPNIIRMIISRMRWPGHVARMGRRGMHVRLWWEGYKERDWAGFIWLRIGTSEGLL
jgi:hypothetical protein